MKRQPSAEKETLGIFQVFDDANENVFNCKTLELPWKANAHNISCVPTGNYLVKKTFTQHLGFHFALINVPKRSGICIHKGNFFTDILGCILVGDAYVDRNKDGILDVINSEATMKKLFAILPNEFTISIQ